MSKIIIVNVADGVEVSISGHSKVSAIDTLQTVIHKLGEVYAWPEQDLGTHSIEVNVGLRPRDDLKEILTLNREPK